MRIEYYFIRHFSILQYIRIYLKLLNRIKNIYCQARPQSQPSVTTNRKIAYNKYQKCSNAILIANKSNEFLNPHNFFSITFQASIYLPLMKRTFSEIFTQCVPYLLGKFHICLQKWYQIKLISLRFLLIFFCAYSITFWIVSNYQIEIIVHKMLKKFVQSCPYTHNQYDTMYDKISK